MKHRMEDSTMNTCGPVRGESVFTTYKNQRHNLSLESTPTQFEPQAASDPASIPTHYILMTRGNFCEGNSSHGDFQIGLAIGIASSTCVRALRASDQSRIDPQSRELLGL